MAPALEKVFNLRSYLSKDISMNLGPVKGGAVRMATHSDHGYLRGDDLDAKMLASNGAWSSIDMQTGKGHMDAHVNFRTEDGASMFCVHFTGMATLDESTSKALQFASDAKTTEFGDHELWMHPIIETNDEKFKWIENTFFIAEGRWVVENGEHALDWNIYKVKPGKA